VLAPKPFQVERQSTEIRANLFFPREKVLKQNFVQKVLLPELDGNSKNKKKYSAQNLPPTALPRPLST
jgi:hypothetical protein